MISEQYSLTADKGMSWIQDVILTQEDETPWDLTGYTAYLEVSSFSTSNSPLFTIDSTEANDYGVITLVEEEGKATWEAYPEAMDISSKQAFYSFYVESAGGRKYRILRGRLNINQ